MFKVTLLQKSKAASMTEKSFAFYANLTVHCLIHNNLPQQTIISQMKMNPVFALIIELSPVITSLTL
jgi:hypothetical protein